MYLVTRNFTDSKDDNYHYKVGDKYPRKGKRPTKARVEALLNGTNKSGLKLIKKVKSPNKGGKKSL